MSEIKSKRLILRQPVLDDAKFLAKGLGDKEVAEYLTVPHPYNLEMAQEWLKQDFVNKSANETSFIVEKKDKTFIGGIGFNERNNVTFLFYWIAKQYWGQGFASEATLAVIEWFFNVSGEDIIFAGAFHFNEASIKIQQNLGFENIGQTNRFCPARNKQVKNIETRLNRKTFLRIKTV